MKQFLLKTIIALLLLTQAASALAYVVKGTVVDATGKPLYEALVLGRNKVGTKVIEIETNKLGQFVSAEVNDSTLSIEITKDTFVPLQINISGTSSQFVDLGTITLFERQVTLGDVVVTAESVMQKAGRYIIIPTKKELGQSANGLSLLNALQYKMPGLAVNEILQTVQVDTPHLCLRLTENHAS